ncbi:hypothetical protein NONI108955_44835 [Nocardia ninae]|uniref:Uncharacterized protein n=1 Tax=Nocardia ninae NBRC 108245 TaxID=1210091 RepID=A0A511MM46_9NOCA|nr:hypothetical protein [Nocardia ninae]GEM41238.1 hypothetical protein NN4_57570 [Nocardia ninae NBRC 108245]
MGKLNRPGHPDDLPDAHLLWKRWAGVAVATYNRERESEPAHHRSGYWIDDGGLHWDDSGCTWWVLKWFGAGRAVLVGEDESSKVKWYEPAIDLLAGAPEWLPRRYLQGLIDDHMVGCVYWFENGAWHRAPYPDDLADDGLDCGVSAFTTREGALDKISGWLEFSDADAGMPELCAELLDAAERGAITERLVRSYAEGMTRLEELYYPEEEYPRDDCPPRNDDDIAAMFALARRAGLDTATWTGTLGVRD